MFFYKNLSASLYPQRHLTTDGPHREAVMFFYKTTCLLRRTPRRYPTTDDLTRSSYLSNKPMLLPRLKPKGGGCSDPHRPGGIKFVSIITLQRQGIFLFFSSYLHPWVKLKGESVVIPTDPGGIKFVSIIFRGSWFL